MTLLDDAHAILLASHHEEERSLFDLATHPKRFVTTNDLATYLDTGRGTIIRMILAGSLTAVKVGREWRIDTEGARQAFHIEKAG